MVDIRGKERLETSVEGIFACGNVLHVHDLVDFVSMEAEKLADGVAEYIENGSLPECTIPVKAASGINHTVPMKVSGKKDVTISMRVGRKFENCTIEVRQGEKVLAKKHLKKALPAEMIQIALKPEELNEKDNLEVRVVC